MPVYQVEEYYLCMTNLTISPEQKERIQEYLDDEGYGACQFQDNDTLLIVDDISDEPVGEHLEEGIKEILGIS